MSKIVKVIVRIPKNGGKVTVRPEGTHGEECISLLQFTDKLEGLIELDRVPLDDDGGADVKEIINIHQLAD